VTSWRFYCSKCGFRGDNGVYYPFCPRCGSPLRVEGEDPVDPSISVLGEGDTPAVEKTFKSVKVAFKLEYLNPTGSFKDRGASTSLRLARLLGYDCVVVDSSGNTAVAVAAYARALGLKARVHVPSTAGPGKLALVRALGADVVVWDSREEAAKAALRDSGKCFYVAHTFNPVFSLGITPLAWELSDYDGWDFIVPVSSGSLLLGLWEGMKRAGLRGRLIAVQAAEAASLRGRVRLLAEVGGKASRLADALVVKNPPRLEEIASAVNESGGGLVVVGDEAIRTALKELLRMGFIVEPSSAVAWAAFTALNEAGDASDSVVILTGSGLKYAEKIRELAAEQGKS
jgi:threonine synthase